MPHNLTVPSSTVALKNACLLYRSDFNPIMTFLRIIESLVVPGWSSSRRLAKSLNEIRATDDSNYPLLCDKNGGRGSDSTCGPSIASNPYMLTVKHQG